MRSRNGRGDGGGAMQCFRRNGRVGGWPSAGKHGQLAVQGKGVEGKGQRGQQAEEENGVSGRERKRGRGEWGRGRSRLASGNRGNDRRRRALPRLINRFALLLTGGGIERLRQGRRRGRRRFGAVTLHERHHFPGP